MKEKGLSARAVITRIEEETTEDQVNDSLNISYTVYVKYPAQDGETYDDVSLGYFRTA